MSFIELDTAIGILDELKRQLEDLVDRTKRKLERLSAQAEALSPALSLYGQVILTAHPFITKEKFRVVVKALNSMADREFSKHEVFMAVKPEGVAWQQLSDVMGALRKLGYLASLGGARKGSRWR